MSLRPEIRHIIMKRMNRDNMRDNLDERDMFDERDFEYNEDFADAEDYAFDEAMDNVRSDSRRGMRGSRRRTRRDRVDRADGHNKHIHLTKNEYHKWKKKLENDDGTRGPHFSANEILKAADDMDLDYNGYTEADICMAANVLYSDLCTALESLIPEEKEAYYYTLMAKCALDDIDGPKGSEKLAAYWYFIADNGKSI